MKRSLQQVKVFFDNTAENYLIQVPKNVAQHPEDIKIIFQKLFSQNVPVDTQNAGLTILQNIFCREAGIFLLNCPKPKILSFFSKCFSSCVECTCVIPAQYFSLKSRKSIVQTAKKTLRNLTQKPSEHTECNFNKRIELFSLAIAKFSLKMPMPKLYGSFQNFPSTCPL